MAHLEDQRKLIKALSRLGTLPASISLLRDGLLAKKQVLLDTIQENRNHLKHLKTLSQNEANFLEKYLHERNQRAYQLQQDKDLLTTQLDSMKMHLESLNLQNE